MDWYAFVQGLTDAELDLVANLIHQRCAGQEITEGSPDTLNGYEQQWVRKGNLIEAVRRFRDRTGSGLKVSVDIAKRYRNSLSDAELVAAGYDPKRVREEAANDAPF